MATGAEPISIRDWSLTRPMMALCLVVLAVGGFVIPAAKPAGAGGMAPLLLQAGGSVTVVRPDEKSVVTFSSAASENAMLNFDGKFVATTKPGANQTTVLEIRDPWTAKMSWTQSVPGDWRVEAISSDGRQVVLGDPSISPHAASVPKGRTSTDLLLAGDGMGSKKITLPGNFVAEAFLANGAGVALIEHLPPMNPSTYSGLFWWGTGASPGNRWIENRSQGESRNRRNARCAPQPNLE